ncbi:hypothetical protein [Mycobacterium sp. ST-F2]|uniref:hypothetical protein n=1 Tax=Mycobacterium sp. ST-F2 TaxID=1490484 RepID=UPI0011534F3A|nr:hypothetical protein [Mycobacterium sp. ST-F2]
MINEDEAAGEESSAPGLVLSQDRQREWLSLACTARASELVLKRVIGPKPGSWLDVIDRIYEKEKASVWTRSYLRAAAEHLSFWSDRIAPHAIVPGPANRILLRPYLLLGRAALESAAHALWVLAAPQSTDEWVTRFVQLMVGDFKLHRKALVAGGLDTARIDERIRAHNARIDGMSSLKPPGMPRYLDLVRHAATATESDENRWAYLWNAAAGAGHGQNWFGVEGYILLDKAEYEPGHYRTVSVPNPSFVTETIGAACAALHAGTARWLAAGKHDPQMLLDATIEAHDRLQSKE